MGKKAEEIRHIYVSENALAQLRDNEQKEYIKRLGENAMRANADIRSQKQSKK
ncbi:hypothetical protein KVQ01_11080 [Escherichia coli]|uniref:hypothetical protein n=1 Tax=Escherichia coli TaxID=562 RepID=UPI001F05D24F|nr:hypothetical protein [Escherichia coli]MCH0685562.1 hypothetical protein [Escherichia coli]MDZ8667063.1 hypothetical protein [Escherichia coli]WRX87645.1 hypothetical protein SM938_22215 [Escherichia coli]